MVRYDECLIDTDADFHDNIHEDHRGNTMHTRTTTTPRHARARRPHSGLSRLPLAVAIYFAIGAAAYAQDTTQAGVTPPPDAATQKRAKTLDTVTVTAQKRSENPQKVPISLEVLGDQKLQELNVKSFDDYVKYLPSVSYEDDGPGSAQIYMRGVADGSDGNHSGPLPSVGVYLDEEPITTIDGPLDIHIYDIARVESLSGPQGTLYGASSQSGTLRIITNKPDPKAFSASYSVEGDSLSHGGVGHLVEGFVNVPFNDHTAIRVVAWDKHDPGFIDNVLGGRQFPIRDPATGDAPSWGGVVSNGTCTSTDKLVCTGTARNNYNTVDTDGARMALKFDLNDNWTITPSVIHQTQRAKGEFSFDPAIGDLKINHFYPEDSFDNWTQAALTVQGKIGNFDLTYAFAHLNRHEHADSDYSDYSFWYDSQYSNGYYNRYDKNGNLINPSQYIQSVDTFGKTSHELRIASPSDWRLSFVGGFYWQKQTHNIQQDYIINGLDPASSVDGWKDTIWLTEQRRTDIDKALFGEATWKFNDQWRITGGIRAFKVDNSLEGYFGFKSGEDKCFAGPFHGAPCENLNKTVRETNHVGKVSLSYQMTPSTMFYGTWSQGYRPGGINRKGDLAPYLSDYLDNWELGFKTTLLDNRLRWNTSVFDERWKNFQFAILNLGDNGLTSIRNANQAEIKGLETSINWKVTDQFDLSGGAAFYDAKLTANYCNLTDPAGNPVTNCPVGSTVDGVDFPNGPPAPKGSQLPVTPKFKADLIGRYNFNIGAMDAYVQAAMVHVGKRASDLRVLERQIKGDEPAYTSVDFSAGIRHHNWAVDAFLQNAFDSRGQVTRFAECTETICGAHGVDPTHPNGQIYVVPIQPRTFGLRFTEDFD